MIKRTPTIRPLPKQHLAWIKLQDHTTKYLLFGGGAGGGKAQTLNSLVLTRSGFVRMGDIKVGHKVITSKNKEVDVIAIHPQGLKDIYEIEFIDGAKTKVTEEHLFDCWIAGKKNTRKVRTLKEIKVIKNNVIIPLSDKLEFGKHFNKIDSYFVGALLGDGGLTKNNITFTTADDEIFDYFNVEDNKIIKKKKYQYSIVSGRRNKKGYPVNQLLNKLKELGILPISCDKRFIPNVIKNGSLNNRLEVLKGLMDTDGTIDSRGHCSFTSKSKQLALDVQYVVRSIGGKATLKQRTKYCYYKGERKDCICYEVYIQTKNNKDLFKLKRKQNRVKDYNGGVSELGRRIKSINLIGKEEAQCITINDSSGLYITDDFIVTHNSWLGCEWLIVMCYQYPRTKWFIGRKELKRLMSSSYETFKKVCSYHKIPESDWKLNGQYNYIEFFNGSKIDLLDVDFKPSDPLFERFGSTEYTGGWLEEAGEINFGAFDVLKTRVGRHLNKEYNLHTKILLTANPKKNWLKRLFYNPFKAGTLSKQYAFIRSLYSDNKYTSDIYGEQLSEISDKATKDRLRDGNWDYDDDNACLVKGDCLMDILTNTVDDGEKYATLDIARFGKDTTKLYLWKGFKNYKRYTWKNKATTLIAELVKQVLTEERIPYSRVIGDEVGVGGGVIDMLTGINGFIANATPLENPDSKPIMVVRNGKQVMITPKENYGSLKDQCGYMLAEKINLHGIALDIQDESEKELILEEIGELKDAKPDEEGKKRLVPKDKIKENIGRSPDDLDNLIMRMWFDLKKEQPLSSSIFIPNNEL